MVSQPKVFVVDDDKGIRYLIAWLLLRSGLNVECCGTSSELLAIAQPNVPGCFLIDLEMPGMGGIELHKELCKKGCRQPFILVSGFGDVPRVVEAMHLGVFDYVEKPFTNQRLVDCVRRAVEHDSKEQVRRAEQLDIGARVSSLTDREQQVLQLVITGQPSKSIARQLGIALKTVEVHRTNIMKKMGVRSVALLSSLVASFNSYMTSQNSLPHGRVAAAPTAQLN